jgi:hypothetical protein
MPKRRPPVFPKAEAQLIALGERLSTARREVTQLEAVIDPER